MTNDPVEDDINRMPDGVKEDRRKHGYAKLEDKIDSEFAIIRKKLTRFFIVVIVLIIFSFGLYLGQRGLTDDIQDQRYNSLITLCQDQNERHNAAIKQINENKLAPAPIKVQLRLLVDQLQPYVADCTVGAKERVKKE